MIKMYRKNKTAMNFFMILGLCFSAVLFDTTVSFADFADDAFSGSAAGWSISTVMGFGLPSGTVGGIILNILSWLLAIVGAVGLIGFMISGVMYILASGDDDMAKKAKSAMKNSAIGVVVALAGFVIIQAVEAMLNASFF